MEFGTTCSHYFLGLKVKYLNFYLMYCQGLVKIPAKVFQLRKHIKRGRAVEFSSFSFTCLLSLA